MSKKVDSPLKWFVLDCGGFESLDYTTAEMLKDLHHQLTSKNFKLVIITSIPQLRDKLDCLDLTEIIGEETFILAPVKRLKPSNPKLI